MVMLGADAMQLYSPVFAFTEGDDPGDKVAQYPRRVSMGSVAIISLSKTEVR